MKNKFLIISIISFISMISATGNNVAEIMIKDRYTTMTNVKAQVDFSNVTGTMDFKNHSLGIGGINAFPMPQKVVEGTAKLKPVMIRIFIQEFFFIEKDNGELDFSALDRYIRSVNATGAAVMASICIKPKSLYPIVDETIWKPNNVQRWQYIIGEMVKRYSVDNKYVTHWGIGNEINIGEYGGCPYKISNVNDYFEYYKMTVEPILRAFPEAKVGGPSWAGTGRECYQFFEAFIGLCTKEKTRLDFISLFLTNYHPESTDDVTLSVYFKNAPQGKARMTVCRIDDQLRWDNDHFKLLPTENRVTYIHDDFWFSLFVPEDSVVMVTFDYDVE